MALVGRTRVRSVLAPPLTAALGVFVAVGVAVGALLLGGTATALSDISAPDAADGGAADPGDTGDTGGATDASVESDLPPVDQDGADQDGAGEDGAGEDGTGDVPCLPSCAEVECGGDGCGGSCGSCPEGQGCDAGTCVDAEPSDGCTESLLPGCVGCSCSECVCELDLACCEVAWDAACAALCSAECGQDCGAETVGCTGFCGGQSPDGCYCDASCITTGDCCSDSCEVCEVCEPEPPGTCEGACGGQSGDGCYCDAACPASGDCCDDACELCGACETGGSDSCDGFCSGQAPSGCFCDGQCAQFDDCCDDSAELCEECPSWLTEQGCCEDGAVVNFCQSATNLSMECATGTACGWNPELAVYDCVQKPGVEPTGTHPQPCDVLMVWNTADEGPDAATPDAAQPDAGDVAGDSVSADATGAADALADGAVADTGQADTGGGGEGSSGGGDSGCRQATRSGAGPLWMVLVAGLLWWRRRHT